MADESLRGRFLWHELLTSDTASAAPFYKKVVGWKTAPWPNDASYTLFMAGSQPVAGLMALPEDAKKNGALPNWMTYIGTGDVDETVRRLTELGGKLLKPAENLPSTGRFAVVQDPQGAVFGLYMPTQPQPGSGRPKVGEFSWHELACEDPAAVWTFYQKLFGWEKTSAMDMGPQGTYQMFGWKGQPVGGIMKRPPNMPSYWMPYAMIADARAAAKTVVKQGGRIANGPMEVPGGDWIVNGIDLQGAFFSVHSLKPVAAKPAAKPASKKAAAPKAKKTAKASRKTKKVQKAKPATKAVAKKKTKIAKKVTRRAAPRRGRAGKKR